MTGTLGRESIRNHCEKYVLPHGSLEEQQTQLNQCAKLTYEFSEQAHGARISRFAHT